MERCKYKCNSILDPRSSFCPGCGRFADLPNIRLARQPNEIKALKNRYTKVMNNVPPANLISIQNFENAIKTKSRVGVSRKPSEVLTLMDTKGKLYSNYDKQVSSGTRVAGYGAEDEYRRQFENAALPKIADLVIFGAFCLDGSGVKHFGSVTMILAPLNSRTRTTAFWGNPMVLSQTLKLQNVETFEPGHRSDWKNRHKLAVSKHAHDIDDTVKTSSDYDSVLNQQSGYGWDYFEAHVYNSFSIDAVKELHYHGTKNSDDEEFQLWNIIKSVAKKDYPDIRCKE